jgi:hypothetical protein
MVFIFIFRLLLGNENVYSQAIPRLYSQGQNCSEMNFRVFGVAILGAKDKSEVYKNALEKRREKRRELQGTTIEILQGKI